MTSPKSALYTEQKSFLPLTFLIPAALLLIIAVVLLVSIYTTYSRTKITAEETLRSSAIEQAATLDALVDGQIDTLETIALEMVQRANLDSDTALAYLSTIVESTSFQHICYTEPDGACYFDDGTIADVAKREYFSRAMAGYWSIQRIDDPVSGDGPLFVLAVPMIKNGLVTGVIHGSYSTEMLERLIIPEIYDGKAYSVICNESGDLLVGTDNPNYILPGDNVFSALADLQLDKEYSLNEIKAAIAGGENGSFSYDVNSEKRYVVYMPLNIAAATGEHWVMFNVVPGAVINAAVGQQNLTNILLFALLLLSLTVLFWLLLVRERKNARLIAAERDQVRANEELYRAAAKTGNLNVARYDIQTRNYYNYSELLYDLGFGDKIEDVPRAFLDAGIVAPESVADYQGFYDRVQQGEKKCSSIISLMVPEGGFRWFRLEATQLFNSAGQPYQAVMVYYDITEQREKETVYTRWQKSLERKDTDSFTIFRCNLSKGASFDIVEGSLLDINFRTDAGTFNARTLEYAEKYVWPDDFSRYVELLNSDYLLACYYRGKTTDSLDYRERSAAETFRWLRLNIEMMQYPDCDDIEIFLMYENIDEAKNAELLVRARTELDPLTGVLNRAAFIEKLEHLLSTSQPDSHHALILLDIDGFKLLNDCFGHAAGDQALVDIAASLRSATGSADLLGRLGGDEFLICLNDIHSQAVVEKRAIQVQALMRKAFSIEVQLSASMGIAVFPADGTDFKTLYHNADIALYVAKENGRDTFSFYNIESLEAVADTDLKARHKSHRGKRLAGKQRMLIVDNDSLMADLLHNMFAEDFFIETAEDTRTAMIRLRCCGSSVAVVLLSLDVPEVDGFYILDSMQGSAEMKSVPVIALSRINERDLSLQSIRHGAVEFILKPFDAEILKIRIESAISKAENERLRAQNSYLQLQNSEGVKYRTLFADTGTVVVEYNWQSGHFAYDPDISAYISGKYDERPLWQIFLSDMVAHSPDVQKMQKLVHQLAADKNKISDSVNVLLKTPEGERNWYTMNAFKRVNEFNMTSKIILTFSNINDNVLADEKLRFQAEHDQLTGLYNRSTFLKKAGEAVRQAAPGFYALLFCDIDHFRFINERFGREEGNKLLKYTADKVFAYTEKGGGICGRLSSDNFAILLPHSDCLEKRAKEVMQHFFDEYYLPARIICRGGVYLVDNPALPADNMLDRAALALAAAKGKYSRFVALYDESMNKKLVFEQEITDRMEQALAEDQFVVYYQPQYNHATGRIVGVEALVRWNDPEQGIISPAVFIPIFEKNGFIVKLDEYVWNKVAEHFHRWLAKGREPVPVSVNVSRENIADPQLCSKLVAIVRKYDLPVELFRLEITESLFSENTARLIEVVDELHQNGFLIEMDDFGSGYSSLNVLKDVPVDVLKLDMKFFSGQGNFGRGGMIVNAVIRMARWLNIPVIAEGVETRIQADFLLSVGCQTIQGFLYAHPMPLRQFEEHFLENQVVVSRRVEERVVTELDNETFWNPESVDSQLFNNYIGAAIVFEYHHEEFEILRLNHQAIAILQLSGDCMLPARGLVNLYEADRPQFKEAVQQVIAEEQEVRFSARRTLESDGSLLTLWITLRLLVKSPTRSLLLAAIEKPQQ